MPRKVATKGSPDQRQRPSRNTTGPDVLKVILPRPPPSLHTHTIGITTGAVESPGTLEPRGDYKFALILGPQQFQKEPIPGKEAVKADPPFTTWRGHYNVCQPGWTGQQIPPVSKSLTPKKACLARGLFTAPFRLLASMEWAGKGPMASLESQHLSSAASRSLS